MVPNMTCASYMQYDVLHLYIVGICHITHLTIDMKKISYVIILVFLLISVRINFLVPPKTDVGMHFSYVCIGEEE